MFVQHQLGSVFIPSFFFPALFVFSLWHWNAQIAFLRCWFPGGVCARRQVSEGKSEKRKKKKGKGRGWGTGRKIKKRRQKGRRESACEQNLPLVSPSWIYAEMLPLPYMLFSNVNARWRTWILQQYGTCVLYRGNFFFSTISSLAKDDINYSETPVSDIQVMEVYNKHAFCLFASPWGSTPWHANSC